MPLMWDILAWGLLDPRGLLLHIHKGITEALCWSQNFPTSIQWMELLYLISIDKGVPKVCMLEATYFLR